MTHNHVYTAIVALLLSVSCSGGTTERIAPSEGTTEEVSASEVGQPDRAQLIEQFHTALVAETDNYRGLTWLGKPIWQPPLDLWTLQETIFEIRPELIIETGTFRGGSSYFFAQLFDLMGQGRVITIDIEKLHDLSHPRITYLIGDSVSPEVVGQVHEEVERTEGPVMVILDSDHTKSHVLGELEVYSRFVSPGSYVNVQDGVIDVLPRFAAGKPGPLAAITEFLERHPEFEVDRDRSERFLITHHPSGWLRRIAGSS